MKKIKLRYKNINKIQLKQKERKNVVDKKDYDVINRMTKTRKSPNIFYMFDIKDPKTWKDFETRKELLKITNIVLGDEDDYIKNQIMTGANIYKKVLNYILKMDATEAEELWYVTNVSPLEFAVIFECQRIYNLTNVNQENKIIRNRDFKQKIQTFIQRNTNININDLTNEKMYAVLNIALAQLGLERIMTIIETFFVGDIIDDLLKNYSSNFVIIYNEEKDEFMYLYISKQGLKKIDEFILKINLQHNPNYKELTYDEKLVEEASKKITEYLTNKKKEIETMTKKQLDNEFIAILKNIPLTETFTQLMPKLVKIMITTIYSSSTNTKKEREQVDEIKSEDNNTYVGLNISYQEACKIIGEVINKSIFSINMQKIQSQQDLLNQILTIYGEIFQSYHETKINNDENFINISAFTDYVTQVILNTSKAEGGYNDDKIKNVKEACRNYDEILTKIEEQVDKFLNPGNRKQSIKSLNKKSLEVSKIFACKYTEELQYAILFLKNLFFDSTMYYNLEQTNPRIIAHLKRFVDVQSLRYDFLLGDSIIKLLDNNILRLVKETNKSITKVYMNEGYYIHTFQKQLFPSFGPENLSMSTVLATIPEKDVLSKHARFIFGFSTAYDEELIRHSPKFRVELYKLKSSKLLEQLADGKNDCYTLDVEIASYFIKNLLDVNTVRKDHNALKDFLRRDPQFFRYFVPKETDLDFIAKYYSEDDLVHILQFVLNYGKKRQEYLYPKVQQHLTSSQLNQFFKVNFTIKYIIGRFLVAAPLTLAFGIWYPKLCMDARGRQYPIESAINLTKEPKMRNMIIPINNVTYYETQDAIKLFESKSKRVTDNYHKIFEKNQDAKDNIILKLRKYKDFNIISKKNNDITKKDDKNIITKKDNDITKKDNENGKPTI